jgi:nucleoside phosphorylase
MHTGHNPKLRFGLSLEESKIASFHPAIANGPPLPPLNFGLVGKQAPSPLPTPPANLPKASAVVITWADAEWAALQHVFCAGNSSMPYSDRSRGTWAGWEKYSLNLPSGAPSDWTFWGYYRLVQVSGNPVLLFKSNTHLDWSGANYLEALVKVLATQVTPDVILSIGTAGGAEIQDHIGTVRIVSAATLYTSGSTTSWPEYKNGWTAGQTVLGNANFKQLLLPVPTKLTDLLALCSQFNQHYRANYTLAQLDPNGLNLGDAMPQIVDQSGGGASLLTTPTFVVGTTAGNYQAYTSIEMDDAIIGEACMGNGVAFGFVRNVSDPVQNAALTAKIQGNWGSTV